MPHDPFSILGLAPGRHAPDEVQRRFVAARQSVLERMNDPAAHLAARRDLEELHLAYAALRTREGQERALLRPGDGDAEDDPEARAARLRRLIADSLEDGLLRYSRRQRILAEARAAGLSEFHTHLLIAAVQFGDRHAAELVTDGFVRAGVGRAGEWEATESGVALRPERRSAEGDGERPARTGADRRVAARFAAVGMLALALFLAAVRWLGA
jgi:hypothetical protein